jgi:hypothetical protein
MDTALLKSDSYGYPAPSMRVLGMYCSEALLAREFQKLTRLLIHAKREKVSLSQNFLGVSQPTNGVSG